jgi:DNA-dependent RNA polymerase auxiliary subunit epsilon
MADTIAEYNRRLEKFRNSLSGYIMSKVAAYAGATIRAQVENRAEQTQKNYKNEFFSLYSPKYLEYRKKKGHQNIHKSFELTRTMWKQFDIVDAEIFNDGFRIKMGGVTDYAQDLIDKHSKREGFPIIDMTEEEMEKLHKWVDIWVVEFANKVGL